jgi:hypothetical protein
MASQSKDEPADAAAAALAKADKKGTVFFLNSRIPPEQKLIYLNPAAEKERQKAEKAKKFEEKQAKQQAAIAANPKTAKMPDHAKNLPKYVEQTPHGEKKGR